MARFDLTDFEWSVIEPLLPTKVRGKKRVDDRRVLNGIFWRLRTGAPWADIPARYGPYTTCVNRFNRWRHAGHWARILNAISEVYDGDIQMIDSSSIRVHQHAANSKKEERSGCMGRSRGGLTTKIHALVDADGRPILLKLTAGQAHDGRSAADMFDTVKTGNVLLADGAYDSDALRQNLKARGAWGGIRPMPNRVNISVFSPWLYKHRNAVERFFNKLKHFRAVATRYDKRDDNFLASVQLASIRIGLRSYESVT
ncbi:IS5 family transposase [Agrobacterium larrymoorei]|uniref:IS5 family transposase n=1 Tax=Agrobacterium larrymoorei TaxID=160699 RepID=UPI001572058A|nr:IS5 family transposase [Agrobacterium larrymoorei]NTJ45095.1 IS5 family transposase [Agrobacterium larrymoorei]